MNSQDRTNTGHMETMSEISAEMAERQADALERIAFALEVMACPGEVHGRPDYRDVSPEGMAAAQRARACKAFKFFKKARDNA